MKPIDVQKETDGVVKFLKTTFQRTGFSNAVIAVSGGLDSAVCLALAVNALGRDNVYSILLPYGGLNTQGTVDAMGLIEQLGISLFHVVRPDITRAVDAIISGDPAINNVRKGNVMARMRMIYLFDQAKKRDALVIGTENKSEHLLGYFTRYGDSASDVEPLFNLYKTQVYELARFLKIPQVIIDKPPTAGLWPNQTDEGELGFSYKEADEILFQLYDEKKSTEEIVASGFSQELVNRVKARVEANSFKHCLPIIPK